MTDDMAGTVLLTGRCKRRRHVMFQVVDTGSSLVIDAPLRAVGRESETWTPERRPLELGRASRYGCPCRTTAVPGDHQMMERIRRGDSEWVIAAINISLR
jgi:hypothetical protein